MRELVYMYLRRYLGDKQLIYNHLISEEEKGSKLDLFEILDIHRIERPNWAVIISLYKYTLLIKFILSVSST